MKDKEKRVPFDREYATTYRSEVRWLREHGIRHTFVKEVNTLITYKYKKNSQLYRCLAEFYEMLEAKMKDKDTEEKE